MYKKPEESSGNVLGYEAWGKLTEEELGAVLADVEEAIERFGKVNLLVYLPEVPRPDLGAIGEDLEFARKHTKDVERYAVVGGGALLGWVAKLEGPLLGIRIKHFQPDRLEEAWRWLRGREAKVDGVAQRTQKRRKATMQEDQGLIGGQRSTSRIQPPSRRYPMFRIRTASFVCWRGGRSRPCSRLAQGKTA